MSRLAVAFNLGSSTLKCSIFSLDDRSQGAVGRVVVDLVSGVCTITGGLLHGLTDFATNRFAEDAAEHILDIIRANGGEVVACLHRVIHGGPRNKLPEVIDGRVLDELEHYEMGCPLQQPAVLDIVRHLRTLLPAVPQIGVFDTAFHLEQPRLASECALPKVIRLDGVRNYGFHGVTCQSIMRQLQRDFPDEAAGCVIVARMGNDVSLTAVRAGRSMATSMGFSTLDGVPMSTRAGSIDPGIILYLLENGWAKSRLTNLLYHQSGLLGLSGLSGDMKRLLASNEDGARFAVEFFCYRAARQVASLACAMEGVDTIVFTAGIGEHEPAVRARIVAQLGWLGAVLDPAANAENATVINAPESHIRLLVLPCREEEEMFLQSRELLSPLPAPSVMNG